MCVKSERDEQVKKVREKKLVFIPLVLMLIAFAVTSIPVKAAAGTVRFYIYNPATGTNIFPGKPYPSLVFVEVWIESPIEWLDTAMGIVGYTVSLRVDPSVVEVRGAGEYPDYDISGQSDGFLPKFLEDFGYWPAFDTAFLIGTVDATAGTIAGTAEAILGFATLGRGAGGTGPMWRFSVRTKYRVDPTTWSPLELYDARYTTVDGVTHPADIVEGGHYNTPPVPEFPLGLGILMMIAPAAPLLYLWRTRRKVIKQ